MANKALIINLFNCGKLKLADAEWYRRQGYAVICSDGKVVDIIREV